MCVLLFFHFDLLKLALESFVTMNVCCCISTSFWVLRATRKLVKTLFRAVFNLFLFISNVFEWFFWLKSRKNSVLSYFLKLTNMQTLVDSLRDYLEFVFFWLIYNIFFLILAKQITERHLKWTKRLKTARKCFDQLSSARSTRKLLKKCMLFQ